jgi:Putative transposase
MPFWKDYRIEGRERYKTMTLATGEFIRRFLMHVLPSGFHRIRHYGLFASGVRIQNITRAHELLSRPLPGAETFLGPRPASETLHRNGHSWITFQTLCAS